MKLLTFKQARAFLQFGRDKTYKAMHAAGARRIGRNLRVEKAMLEQWVKQQEFSDAHAPAEVFTPTGTRPDGMASVGSGPRRGAAASAPRKPFRQNGNDLLRTPVQQLLNSAS